MKHIYNISIWFSLAIIHLSKLFHKKARLWAEGRKNIFHKLKQSTKNKKDIVWFHCASLAMSFFLLQLRKKRLETTVPQE